MNKKWHNQAFLVLGTLGLLVLLPIAGFSGEHHDGASLMCFDCHTIHGSQQQEDEGIPGQRIAPLPSTPREFLLHQTPLNSLCLVCHVGRTFVHDLYGENTGMRMRQEEVLTTTSAPFEYSKGRTLDRLIAPMGGYKNIKATQLTPVIPLCWGAGLP